MDVTYLESLHFIMIRAAEGATATSLQKYRNNSVDLYFYPFMVKGISKMFSNCFLKGRASSPFLQPGPARNLANLVVDVETRRWYNPAAVFK